MHPSRTSLRGALSSVQTRSSAELGPKCKVYIKFRRLTAKDREMTYLGRQIMAELFDCDEGALRDLAYVRKAMEKAAEAAKVTVVQSAFHKFGDLGVSGVLVIAESHLSIHTWPEYRYAAIDLFTCGEKAKPEGALKVLAKSLNSRRVVSRVVLRGTNAELEIAESVLPDSGV